MERLKGKGQAPVTKIPSKSPCHRNVGHRLSTSLSKTKGTASFAVVPKDPTQTGKTAFPGDVVDPASTTDYGAVESKSPCHRNVGHRLSTSLSKTKGTASFAVVPKDPTQTGKTAFPGDVVDPASTTDYGAVESKSPCHRNVGHRLSTSLSKTKGTASFAVVPKDPTQTGKTAFPGDVVDPASTTDYGAVESKSPCHRNVGHRLSTSLSKTKGTASFAVVPKDPTQTGKTAFPGDVVDPASTTDYGAVESKSPCHRNVGHRLSTSLSKTKGTASFAVVPKDPTQTGKTAFPGDVVDPASTTDPTVMEKIRIPTKVLFDAMMQQLGLPNAVYSTQKARAIGLDATIHFYRSKHQLDNSLPRQSISTHVSNKLEDVEDQLANEALNKGDHMPAKELYRIIDSNFTARSTSRDNDLNHILSQVRYVTDCPTDTSTQSEYELQQTNKYYLSLDDDVEGIFVMNNENIQPQPL
ncbi:hypothetical protein TRIUR3_23801 [Triticum urartu]|uniref:Uncharacterized protein n=1 Tax=Triticum urartu TaxID=4572 RepID=M7YZB0_TRIUA|nr:hypothetical protein TRIUR3_23801 [Triticum urartu]